MTTSTIQNDDRTAQLATAAAAVERLPEITVSRELIDREWDAFLATTPGGHHVQTSIWAQLKATLGWKVLRLIAKDNGQIVGGAQILIRNYGPRLRIGYIAKGPLFSIANSRTAASFMDALAEQTRANNLSCTIMQPAHGSAPFSDFRGYNYHPVRFATLLQATTVVDLNRELDDILMGMKRKTRRNVRQSQQSGLRVRRGTEEDLNTFYDLFTATANRKGFRDYSKSYFEQLWRLFSPGDHIQLFLAEKDGKPVSAALRLAFGDTVICKKRGWSGAFGDLRPNEAVEWAAIRWAKEAGYRFYDFEGLPRATAEAVLRGERLPAENVQSPASYKLGYGGEVRILPDSLACFSNRLIRWGHRVLYPKIANWQIIDRIVCRFKLN